MAFATVKASAIPLLNGPQINPNEIVAVDHALSGHMGNRMARIGAQLGVNFALWPLSKYER